MRSGWKQLQSPMTLEKSGRKSEESDPDYNNEEGGSAQSSSEASGDNEVNTSSSEQLNREMLSKNRHIVRNDTREGGSENAVEGERGKQVTRNGKGVEVNGKGKVEEFQKTSTIDEGDDKGLKQVVGGVDVIIRHRYALEANPETKYFKLRHGEVPFSYFDVVLVTSLPATGKCVAVERSKGTNEVEEC
ncbi:hypothetical protein Cgig2_000320 [Carnegiea gigantea]|uniref:Uncharacterized protein n=1 Tax=Carnegiea gigantea TaxID=171969 RepID=A0A9Q1GN52_9CARY|nr:hypothetical protein Cgig2_000320 [Carnegiea gigantea]